MDPSAIVLILFKAAPDSKREELMRQLRRLAADVANTMPGYLREKVAFANSDQWVVIAYFDSISAAREYKDVSNQSSVFPDLIRLVDTDSITMSFLELV